MAFVRWRNVSRTSAAAARRLYLYFAGPDGRRVCRAAAEEIQSLERREAERVGRQWASDLEGACRRLGRGEADERDLHWLTVYGVALGAADRAGGQIAAMARQLATNGAENLTVGRVVTMYLQDCRANLSPRGYSCRASEVRTWERWVAGERGEGCPISEALGPAMLGAYRRHRAALLARHPRSRDGGRRALNRDRQALVAIEAWLRGGGHEHHLPGVDVGKALPKLSERPRQRDLLDAEAFERLLLAARTYRDEHHPSHLRHDLILRLLGEVGFRRAELAAAQWNDFDLDGAPPTVRIGPKAGFATKTGGTRVVPLRLSLAAELKAWRAGLPEALAGGDAYLLSTGTKRPRRMRDVPRKAMTAIYRAAGLQFGGVHDLRHLATVNFLEAIGELSIVREFMGHASTATTAEIYSRHKRGQQWFRRAADLWEKAGETSANGSPTRKAS